MPEVDIKIGGRTFAVACQAGEEHFLQSAADLLNGEVPAHHLREVEDVPDERDQHLGGAGHQAELLSRLKSEPPGFFFQHAGAVF